MFCGKCGNRLEADSKFCPHCGATNSNYNSGNNINNNQTNSPMIVNTVVSKPKKNSKKGVVIAIVFGVIWMNILAFIIIGSHANHYYFDDGDDYVIGGSGGGGTGGGGSGYDADDDNGGGGSDDNGGGGFGGRVPDNDVFAHLIKQAGDSTKRDQYGTLFVYNNTYSGEQIDDIKTAQDLIIKDSVEQKSVCPKEINAIEQRIMKENDILAVNLCEMDVETAKQFADALKRLWDDFPGAKGYLSNIGIFNVRTMDDTRVYAYFQPAFEFETYGYYSVLKAHVELNASFYLNLAKLDKSIEADVKAGFHPKNTNNRYSIVVHELGHYIEFALIMKEHGVSNVLLYNTTTAWTLSDAFNDWGYAKTCLEILNDAYNQNKKEKNITLSFDAWRATISTYAVARDNEGDYIYHETIAEAISDYEVNRQNANDASIYIVKEIQKRLGR